MRFVGIIFVALFQAAIGNALVISEIMSNPVGDDSGREWVELYNDSVETIDVSTVGFSVKGGSFVSVVPLQGGTMLAPGGYAIVSSIVSASSPVSKFLDTATGYPSYTGIVLRVSSSVSFVNTGTTSLDVRLHGSVVDSLTYSPAGEGKTLSKVNGVFVSGNPTPGDINQESQTATLQGSGGSQVTMLQTSPPSPDIILYLPESRLVVAGAETEFSVYGTTKLGKHIDDLSAVWSFGDGGQAVGSTTTYAYAYPGHYIVRVDAGNTSVRGVGTTYITVVVPEISIRSFGVGKYGAYVDIDNRNEYDLDISQWRLVVGHGQYTFPKNTILAKRSVTRIAGRAMGFDKHTFQEGEMLKIIFPNLEEVASFLIQPQVADTSHATTTAPTFQARRIPSSVSAKVEKVSLIVTSASSTPLASNIKPSRDIRLASWIRSFFAR